MNRLIKKMRFEPNKISNRLRRIYLILAITVFTLINTNPVSAGGFGDSIFAVGTKNLFTDIGKYLIILAPIAGAAVGAYFFIRRGAADEMDQKKWNDRIKTTVVSTLGAVLIGTLIVLIASYYGKSITTGIE